MADHAGLVHLPFPGGDLSALFGLEDLLIAAIEEAHVGDLDGNEMGQGQATLYMYGPDADRLFEFIDPVLRAARLGPGFVAVKRYGEPGAREQRVPLT